VSAQIFYTTPGMKGMMSQLLVCVVLNTAQTQFLFRSSHHHPGRIGSPPDCLTHSS